MNEAARIIREYAYLLDKKELLLIAQKRAVRAFLKTPHNYKDTKRYLNDLVEKEAELEIILSDIIMLKRQREFRKEAEILCDRCEKLDRYVAGMNKVLSDDLAEKKGQRLDWVKNTTFLFGLPISFFVAVKNGLFHNHTTPEQAAGIGAAISSGVLAVDKITASFRAVGKAVCVSARKAGGAIRLFYATTKLSLCNKKVAVGQKAQRFSATAKKKVRKVLRRPDIQN